MKKVIGFASILAVVALLVVIVMKNGSFAKSEIAISVSDVVKVGEKIEVKIEVPENITSYSGGKILFYSSETGNEEVLAPITIKDDGIDEPLSVREITKSVVASKEGTIYVEVRFTRINENSPYTSNRIPVKVLK